MQLQNLINPKLFLTIKNNKVSIIETNNSENDKLYEVIIENLLPNTFVFSTDKNLIDENGKREEIANKFLNSKNNRINKNCDGILVYQDDQDLYVVICELKSEQPEPGIYERQLMNGKLLVEYLINLFNELYEGEESKLNLKKVYFALFYKRKKEQKEFSEKELPRLKPYKPVEPIINFKQMKVFINEQIRKVGFSKSHKNYISWQHLTSESTDK
jgi:hypothetical protein